MQNILVRLKPTFPIYQGYMTNVLTGSGNLKRSISCCIWGIIFTWL